MSNFPPRAGELLAEMRRHGVGGRHSSLGYVYKTVEKSYF